jgi:hypothetical protein
MSLDSAVSESAKLRVETVNSVSDLVKQVTDLSNHWRDEDDKDSSQEEEGCDGQIWFRGVSRNDYLLLPKIFRDDSQLSTKIESDMFELFRVMAHPFAQLSCNASAWDWYFLAQHFGYPTRLLDWSTNLLVAAYFAVLDAFENEEDEKKEGDSHSAAVWVLDPGAMNSCLHGCDNPAMPSDNSCALSSDWLKGVGLSGNLTVEKPLALFGRRTNDRIVAQAGVFTVHGSAPKALETILLDHSCSRIVRFDIPGKEKANFLCDLDVLGVHAIEVFPEIASVAKYVPWKFGNRERRTRSKTSTTENS